MFDKTLNKIMKQNKNKVLLEKRLSLSSIYYNTKVIV